MRLTYLKNGESLKIDRDKCTGCGICLDVCPHNVFEISDKKACVHDRPACMECGACALNCPAGAITVGSGVGCAAAVYSSLIKGKKDGEICCGPECSGDEDGQQTDEDGCCCG